LSPCVATPPHQELVAANRLRSWGIEYVGDLYSRLRLDAIVLPTVGRTAPPMPTAAAATGESNTALVMALVKHIFLGNLLGLPALTVPIGLGESTALPIGLQLMGAWWEEAKLLRLSCSLEEVCRRAAPPLRPLPPSGRSHRRLSGSAKSLRLS